MTIMANMTFLMETTIITIRPSKCSPKHFWSEKKCCPKKSIMKIKKSEEEKNLKKIMVQEMLLKKRRY